MRGGAIGDFIMTLPALGALREHWPAATIEVLGYPRVADLVCGRYYVDATRSIEAKPLAGFFIPNAVLDPDLRDYFGSFQVVLSYLFDPDEVFAGNVRRCGVKQFIAGSPRPGDQPAAVHYCQPLAQLAITVAAPTPRLYLNAADRAFAARYLAGAPNERLAVIHPGSGSESKNWPATKFAALGRWLGEQQALRVLVVQGEADEAAVRQCVAGLASQPVRILRGLKLLELAAVIERCAVFVGNDSGITHLAAAVGTPTVALFGPASTAVWEPRGPRVRVVAFGTDDEQRAREAVGELLKSLGTGHLP